MQKVSAVFDARGLGSKSKASLYIYFSLDLHMLVMHIYRVVGSVVQGCAAPDESSAWSPNLRAGESLSESWLHAMQRQRVPR